MLVGCYFLLATAYAAATIYYATPRRIEQRAGEPIWHDKYYAISQYTAYGSVYLFIHFLLPHCAEVIPIHGRHGPASINSEQCAYRDISRLAIPVSY